MMRTVRRTHMIMKIAVCRPSCADMYSVTLDHRCESAVLLVIAVHASGDILTPASEWFMPSTLP